MLAVPRSGLDQSSFQLNVQACRLVLDILPGLEVAVLNETDGLVTQVLSYPYSIRKIRKITPLSTLLYLLVLNTVSLTEPRLFE